MKKGRKLLCSSKERPRLIGGIGKHRRGKDRPKGERRLSRSYVTFLSTALIGVLLCAVLLFSLCFEGFEMWIEQLASKVVGWSFMDLSGGGDGMKDTSASNTETEKIPSISFPASTETGEGQTPPLTLETLYLYDYLAVPKGEIPILPKDLSLSHYGDHYILNDTGLTPNPERLLSGSLSAPGGIEYMSYSDSPKVLIIHTHGTEAYSEDGALSYREGVGELARSTDPKESVVAVGQILAEELNRLGIRTVHCTILHDREQYRNSYARAKETIEKYLERYPGIQLIIDVHRDSVIQSTGELIRPVTLWEEEAVAQVMCVVGSDWGGEENPHWERNLALALKLRQRMNQQCPAICRPPYLKSSTYNQELAPYSILLEMGASGNSVEEAKRAALLVASSLAELWDEM